MVKLKPFVIEYHQNLVFTGYEFAKKDGSVFNSVKEMKKHTGVGEFESYDILFCPNCQSGHRMVTWGFPGARGRSVKKKGCCPNCGERISAEYGAYQYEHFKVVETTSFGKEFQVMHAGGSTPAHEIKALKWWPVEDDKLAIELVFEMYFSRTMYGKYWLEKAQKRYRYIFNLKTGQAYMMAGIDRDGKPSKYSIQKQRLQNYTFSMCPGLPPTIHNDFIRIVLDALKQAKGIDYQYAQNVAEDGLPWKTDEWHVFGQSISVHNLNQLNYFSDMKGSDVADMLTVSWRDSKEKRNLRNLIALSQGEVEWLPKYMQKRSIRHRLNKRAIAYYMYRWLYKCGVRDVNIMNTIVDAHIDMRSSSSTSIAEESMMPARPMNRVVLAHCLNHSSESVDFVKWAVKGRNAESTKNFIESIFNADDFIFSDSVRMLKYLPKAYRPAKASGNLREVHDELVVLDRKWRFGNKPIDYTDVEKALEIDCGEYSFRLAKDTDSLYDIGKQMGICVGSYGREAVAKNCTILTMQKADQYVACIELRVRKKHAAMVQLKSRFNHTVSEIEPVVEWVNITGVDPNCSDYQYAINHQKSGFDYRNRDYHVENPRLEGLEDHRVLNGPIDEGQINWAHDDFAFAGNLPF